MTHYHVIQGELYVTAPLTEAQAKRAARRTLNPKRIVECDSPVNGEFCDLTLTAPTIGEGWPSE